MEEYDTPTFYIKRRDDDVTTEAWKMNGYGHAWEHYGYYSLCCVVALR